LTPAPYGRSGRRTLPSVCGGKPEDEEDSSPRSTFSLLPFSRARRTDVSRYPSRRMIPSSRGDGRAREREIRPPQPSSPLRARVTASAHKRSSLNFFLHSGRWWPSLSVSVCLAPFGHTPSSREEDAFARPFDQSLPSLHQPALLDFLSSTCRVGKLRRRRQVWASAAIFAASFRLCALSDVVLQREVQGVRALEWGEHISLEAPFDDRLPETCVCERGWPRGGRRGGRRRGGICAVRTFAGAQLLSGK